MYNHDSFVSRLKIKAVVTTSIEHISSILPQYDIFGIEDAHYEDAHYFNTFQREKQITFCA